MRKRIGTVGYDTDKSKCLFTTPKGVGFYRKNTGEYFTASVFEGIIPLDYNAADAFCKENSPETWNALFGVIDRSNTSLDLIRVSLTAWKAREIRRTAEQLGMNLSDFIIFIYDQYMRGE